MPELIAGPTCIEAAGEPPKSIQEYVGRVNSGEPRVSVAHMHSPPGWSEPPEPPSPLRRFGPDSARDQVPDRQPARRGGLASFTPKTNLPPGGSAYTASPPNP